MFFDPAYLPRVEEYHSNRPRAKTGAVKGVGHFRDGRCIFWRHATPLYMGPALLLQWAERGA